MPLVLGIEAAKGVCSKSKFPTTHNHHHRRRRHHHLFLKSSLKVFIVARAIFKRRNPGAAEDGAEDVLGFLDIATMDLVTHACPLLSRH